MLSLKLEELLIPSVKKLNVCGDSVNITIVARAVGHGSESHAVQVRVPHNRNRDLLEHAEYAWTCAVLGEYPAVPNDRIQLVSLATHMGEGMRAHFTPFTPFNMHGPERVTWDMFSKSTLIDGKILGDVYDESFDWQFDSAALTGDVPTECFPFGDVLIESIGGTLEGSRVLEGTVSAEHVCSIDADVVFGTLSTTAIPRATIGSSHVMSLCANKIQAPHAWSSHALRAFSISTMAGRVHEHAIPLGLMQLAPGMDLSLARGKLNVDFLADRCVTARSLFSVNASCLTGNVHGSIIASSTIESGAFAGPIDASKVQGSLVNQTVSVSCTNLRTGSMRTKHMRMYHRLDVDMALTAQCLTCMDLTCRHINAPDSQILSEIASCANLVARNVSTLGVSSANVECEELVVGDTLSTKVAHAHSVQTGVATVHKHLQSRDVTTKECAVGDVVTVRRTMATNALDILANLRCERLEWANKHGVADIQSLCADRLLCSRALNVTSMASLFTVACLGQVVCKHVDVHNQFQGADVHVSSGLKAATMACEHLQLNNNLTVHAAEVIATMRAWQLTSSSALCKTITSRRAFVKNLESIASARSASMDVIGNVATQNRIKIDGTVLCRHIIAKPSVELSNTPEMRSGTFQTTRMQAKTIGAASRVSSRRVETARVSCQDMFCEKQLMIDSIHLPCATALSKDIISDNVAASSAVFASCGVSKSILSGCSSIGRMKATKLHANYVTCENARARSGLNTYFARLANIKTALARMGIR